MNQPHTANTAAVSAEVRLPARGRDFAFHFAAEYRERGWSVIPLDGKRPAVLSWREFQMERASLKQLRNWFSGQSSVNVGIVTGKLSGLIVVDCDTPEDAEYWQHHFPKTPLTVQTGGGGSHFYYRYPTGEAIGNRAKLLARQIDLRGEGGYVVAPPSVHSSGANYEWLSGSDYSLDCVPFFSSEWIAEKKSEAPPSCRNVKSPLSYIRSIHAISGRGGHNQTFRAACILRDAGLSPEEALCELMLWNETHAVPPWSARELLHKVQSAYTALGGRTPGATDND